MDSPIGTRLDLNDACRSEEVEAKRWMDRASRYLTEGRFESAIRLIEKTDNVFPNCKNLPELMAVTQVCYAATWRACYCDRPYTRKLPDWYHVLKVDEKADFDTIKKRYRQLALLLHPDKNKHVNSEGAFKLISEAYACLSDKQKREAFNFERRRSFCTNCNLRAQMHSAGHGSRPMPEAQKLQPSNLSSVFNNSTSWGRESESLQNLRERAKARVTSLEREWGSKRSKWIQQLATVRERYKGNRASSPTSTAAHQTAKVDPMPSGHWQEEAYTSKGSQKTRSQSNFSPKVVINPKLRSDVPEVRRASTSDAKEERTAKIEENLDSLLKRLKSENSATARESPMLREFGVRTSTREAENVARPFNVKRVQRSSSVDRRWSSNDAGLGFSCMPRGRCLSKKGISPLINLSTGQGDSALPKVFTSDPKGQCKPKVRVLGRGEDEITSGSTRFSVDSGIVTKEELRRSGSRPMSRTSSGNWTGTVNLRPEAFEELVTSVFPSTIQTPIQRRSLSCESESFVLRTPPAGCGDNGQSKVYRTLHPVKPLSEQVLRKTQRGGTFPLERRVSSAGNEVHTVLSPKVHPVGAERISAPQARAPLGSRSENVTSFSINLNHGSNSLKACKVEKQKAVKSELVDDLEQKQKTDALNGILERLRAEAKTVAATLDRLRENFAAENTTVVH